MIRKYLRLRLSDSVVLAPLPRSALCRLAPARSPSCNCHDGVSRKRCAPYRVAIETVVECGVEQRGGRIVEFGPLQQCQVDAGKKLRIVAVRDDGLLVEHPSGDLLSDLL